jgi:hypothetical protein
MSSAIQEARSAIVKAKDDMAKYYNRKRVPAPEYKVGDKVYLDSSDIRTTRPSTKLAHRFLGPFLIAAKVGSHSYRLKLPVTMSRLHPVFHVVKLRPTVDDTIPGRRPKPPPLPEIREDGEHYEVKQILDSRIFRRKLEFKVRWEGYGPEHDQWLPEKDLDAPELLKDFYRNHPDAPRAINGLIFRPRPIRPWETLQASGRRLVERGGGVRTR